jgi:hypothetical protein
MDLEETGSVGVEIGWETWGFYRMDLLGFNGDLMGLNGDFNGT